MQKQSETALVAMKRLERLYKNSTGILYERRLDYCSQHKHASTNCCLQEITNNIVGSLSIGKHNSIVC